MKEAKTAQSTAESEQKTGDASLTALTASKAKIELAMAGTFVPLKEGTKTEDKEVKAGVSELVKLSKEFDINDPSLLTSLPSALTKPPDSRGTFDTLVIGQVETQL